MDILVFKRSGNAEKLAAFPNPLFFLERELG
jgi:hypothetical protein